MITIQERVEIVLGHAEALADEAADIGYFHVSDRLRLLSSRLAIDHEIVESALVSVGRARGARNERLAHLRACNRRFDVEATLRVAGDEASAFLNSARVSAMTLAGYRLRQLTPALEAQLGEVAAALRTAHEAMDKAEDELLSATAAEFLARARCNGRQEKLRIECERAKAELLAAMPADTPAAARIRRRVVRTRRANARPSFRPDTTCDGEPVA
jgi:hypothetical protein